MSSHSQWLVVCCFGILQSPFLGNICPSRLWFWNGNFYLFNGVAWSQHRSDSYFGWHGNDSGPRAAWSLCLKGKIFGRYLCQCQIYAVYSHGGLTPWRILLKKIWSISDWLCSLRSNSMTFAGRRDAEKIPFDIVLRNVCVVKMKTLTVISPWHWSHWMIHHDHLWWNRWYDPSKQYGEKCHVKSSNPDSQVGSNILNRALHPEENQIWTNGWIIYEIELLCPYPHWKDIHYVKSWHKHRHIS